MVVGIRHHADRGDRGDTRPRPPELDLKAQDAEAVSELQKEQEIKQKEKKSRESIKADLLQEAEVSKAEQREINWGILKTLVKYIWPKVVYYSDELIVG